MQLTAAVSMALTLVTSGFSISFCFRVVKKSSDVQNFVCRFHETKSRRRGGGGGVETDGRSAGENEGTKARREASRLYHNFFSIVSARLSKHSRHGTKIDQ